MNPTPENACRVLALLGDSDPAAYTHFDRYTRECGLSEGAQALAEANPAILIEELGRFLYFRKVVRSLAVQ